MRVLRHTAVYYLGLALLFTHELDAMTHAEWRLLPGLQRLPDPTASALFVALHVPLFFIVLWLSQHLREAIRQRARSAAAFLVIHAVLHISLSSAPAYTFDGALSNTLILAAGVCGLGYLLARRARRR